MSENNQDHIIVEDHQGNQKEFAVEALFDTRDESFALLKSGNEKFFMKIEEKDGKQYLSRINDPIEREAITDTYQIVVQND